MPSYDPYRRVSTLASSRRRGSFLIKLVLVVAAAAAIMAIVVPRYVSAEKLGKELTVKGFLRAIAAVNNDYRGKHKTYAEDLESLAKHAGIETLIESTRETGYELSYRGSRHGWSCTADPGVPGTVHFFIDQSGVLRFRPDATAGADDAKVE